MKTYRMGLILAGSISLDSPFNQCAFKSFTTCAFRVRREFSKPRQWDHHFSHEKICSSGFEKIHLALWQGKDSGEQQQRPVGEPAGTGVYAPERSRHPHQLRLNQHQGVQPPQVCIQI